MMVQEQFYQAVCRRYQNNTFARRLITFAVCSSRGARRWKTSSASLLKYSRIESETIISQYFQIHSIQWLSESTRFSNTVSVVQLNAISKPSRNI